MTILLLPRSKSVRFSRFTEALVTHPQMTLAVLSDMPECIATWSGGLSRNYVAQCVKLESNLQLSDLVLCLVV
jgi:hypothetical protein